MAEVVGAHHPRYCGYPTRASVEVAVEVLVMVVQSLVVAAARAPRNILHFFPEQRLKELSSAGKTIAITALIYLLTTYH